MKKNSLSKKIIIALSLIVLALITQLFFKGKPSSKIYFEAEKKDFGIILGYGQVKSLDEQLVTANSKGRILDMFVTEGDMVNKDQVLFNITPEQYEKRNLLKKSERRLLELALKEEKLDNQLLLLNIDSTINNLKIEKELSEKYISKREKLANTGVFSSFEYDKTKQELAILNSKVQQEVQKKEIMVGIFNEKIKALEEKLAVFDKQYELEFRSLYEISATIDGIVQDIYIKKGQFVDVGKEILNIVGENDVKVIIDVSQNKASKVNINDKAEIINGTEIIAAKVYNKSTKVDSGVISITLEAQEKNNLSKFINHSISGRIYTDNTKSLLVVKYSDTFEPGSSQKFKVLNQVKNIQERVIRFGEKYQNYIAVNSGLLSGEKIILSE